MQHTIMDPADYTRYVSMIGECKLLKKLCSWVMFLEKKPNGKYKEVRREKVGNGMLRMAADLALPDAMGKFLIIRTIKPFNNDEALESFVPVFSENIFAKESISNVCFIYVSCSGRLCTASRSIAFLTLLN